MKIWKKATVRLLAILLLSGCQWLKAKADRYMLVFEAVNGLEITASHGDYRDEEAFLEFPVPIRYLLDRSEYRVTIALQKRHKMPPRFDMQAVNKLTNEHYYINTDIHRFDCYAMDNRMVMFDQDPKTGLQFDWSSISNHDECQEIEESGETEWVEFQLYNHNRQLVATEKLAFHFVKNGYYLYK